MSRQRVQRLELMAPRFSNPWKPRSRARLDWQNVGRLLLWAGLQMAAIVLFVALIFWMGAAIGDALLAGS